VAAALPLLDPASSQPTRCRPTLRLCSAGPGPFPGRALTRRGAGASRLDRPDPPTDRLPTPRRPDSIFGAPVAQEEIRRDISDGGEDDEGGVEAEAEEAKHREEQGREPLQDSELVRPQLDVGADQVLLQPADSQLLLDPRRSPGRLESPAELLADVVQLLAGTGALGYGLRQIERALA